MINLQLVVMLIALFFNVLKSHSIHIHLNIHSINYPNYLCTPVIEYLVDGGLIIDTLIMRLKRGDYSMSVSPVLSCTVYK